MHHPRIGERVVVRPTNPAVPVQRGDQVYGQFLPPDGQECLWDDFLHRRWLEGAVSFEPLVVVAAEAEKEPA